MLVPQTSSFSPSPPCRSCRSPFPLPTVLRTRRASTTKIPRSSRPPRTPGPPLDLRPCNALIHLGPVNLIANARAPGGRGDEQAHRRPQSTLWQYFYLENRCVEISRDIVQYFPRSFSPCVTASRNPSSMCKAISGLFVRLRSDHKIAPLLT